ncbi:hypothetical protein [Syntrophomonas palmitatica]|uniref:hypothetical protein n=1 Tax=Syntrophomonas palmitatica TaxID=402877 RepID=UPI0006D008FA|nr:hypothetical protein [Syntrophomonas palmitatica]
MICRGFYGIKIYKQDGGSIFNLKPFIRLLLICMLVTVVLAGYNNTAQANGGISMRPRPVWPVMHAATNIFRYRS